MPYVRVGRMLNILIVDDEPDLCDLIAETLREEGYQVTCSPRRCRRDRRGRRGDVRRGAGGHAAAEDGWADAVSPAAGGIGVDGRDPDDRQRQRRRRGGRAQGRGVRLPHQARPARRAQHPAEAHRLVPRVAPRRRRGARRAGERDAHPRAARRPLTADADRRPAHRGHRPQRRVGCHHGRERHRQGAGGARASRRRRAARQALRRGQLRGVSRHADRVGAVRPRTRRLHGRHQSSRRPLRGGARRHVVPGRSRRSCRRPRRQSCFACCRKGRSSRWAATIR